MRIEAKQHPLANIKQRLIDRSVHFYSSLIRYHSKAFRSVFKVTISTLQCVQKSVKDDRKLLQRLLNAVIAGRSVEMESVLKHELSPVPLCVTKYAGQMNSAPKADIVSILMPGIRFPHRFQLLT